MVMENYLQTPHQPEKRSSDQSSFTPSSSGATCPDSWYKINDLGYSELQELLLSSPHLYGTTSQPQTREHLANSQDEPPRRSSPANINCQTPEPPEYSSLSDRAFFNSLWQRLKKDTVVLKDEKRFLPWNILKCVLNQRTVEEYITRAGFEREQLSQIYGTTWSSSRLQILATLILSRCFSYHHLKSFFEHQIFDDALPLYEQHPVFFSWESWESSEEDGFCKKQYTVLSPCFNFTRDKLRHYVFESSIRMPFLDVQKNVGEGGDGTISMVRIHKDHHFGDANTCFGQEGKLCALKLFTDYSKFFNEREALERFSGSNPGHDHLARLLLSYQRNGKYFMMFDWADEDLTGFWKNYSSNPRSPDQLRWLMRQCHGMAQGLSKVHGDEKSQPFSNETDTQDRGRHGDIKPGNILCFGQGTGNIIEHRLVVADFTLMRFHSLKSLGATSAGSVRFSPSYRPPEKDLGGKFRIDQPYDVWTLGCVYLEFLTWYLLGYQAVHGHSFSYSKQDVQSFQEVRLTDKVGKGGYPQDHFFEIRKMGFGYSRGKVKPSVTKWFHFLHRNEYCSEAIHDFLNLIENHMLLPNPRRRWKMFEICAEFGRISDRCEKDSRYCLQGLPFPMRWLEKDFPPVFTVTDSVQACSTTTGPVLPTETISDDVSDTGVLEIAFRDFLQPVDASTVQSTDLTGPIGNSQDSDANNLLPKDVPQQEKHPNGHIESQIREDFQKESTTPRGSIRSAIRNLRKSPRRSGKGFWSRIRGLTLIMFGSIN